jgi:hypothetical protein
MSGLEEGREGFSGRNVVFFVCRYKMRGWILQRAVSLVHIIVKLVDFLGLGF